MGDKDELPPPKVSAELNPVKPEAP
jgi:hypothetical protein